MNDERCEVCGADAQYTEGVKRCRTHIKYIYRHACRCGSERLSTRPEGSALCRQCREGEKPQPAQAPASTPSSTLADDILKRIRREAWSVPGLADALDVSPRRVNDALSELRAKGYIIPDGERISLDSPSPSARDNVSVVKTAAEGKDITIGAIGDTHLGSKWERLDVLNKLYDIFAAEGVRDVYHCGNMIEGEARFNKFDVKVWGMEAQTAYCAEHYPQREGITTRYVTGDDHEGWYTQREGIDWGRRMEQTAREAGREDMVYLGHVEADICLRSPGGDAVMRVCHPGGGSAYALSYTSQKLVESLQGGEKPAIILAGHYHKFEYCFPRNVHVVQVGTTQDQSIFMRKKRLEAHVGGCVLRFRQGSEGEVARFRVEWFPFFDRGFYERKYDITRVEVYN